VEVLLIAPGRNQNRPRLALSLVVEPAAVAPSAAFVESPSSRIASDYGKPCRRVPAVIDPPFGIGQQHDRDPVSARQPGDVDLLDLVISHHCEAGNFSVDRGDSSVSDPLGRSCEKRFSSSAANQFVGHIAEMAIAPSDEPDFSYRRGIIGLCVPYFYLVHYYVSITRSVRARRFET
jgi:hypothetical protein